jgi:hypothetical protein
MLVRFGLFVERTSIHGVVVQREADCVMKTSDRIWTTRPIWLRSASGAASLNLSRARRAVRYVIEV